MRQYWTAEEDNKIQFNKRKDESWKEFTERELPHRTHEAVRLHAVRHLGINNKQYKHRIHSFDKDAWKHLTPESCYWAGFIAADGCLIHYGPNCGKGYSLAIDLQQKDYNHLLQFKDFCKYTGELQKTRKKGNSTTQSIRINIGLDWVEDLKNNFNITPKKTQTLQPPSIEDEYLKWCYIIGFIDGDGTIHYNEKSNSKLQLKVVGASFEFIEWLQKEFSKLTENCSLRNKTRTVNKKAKYPIASLSGNSACAAVDYLSSFPVAKLNRKWSNKSVITHIKQQKEKYPDKFIKNKYNKV